ncbi:phosphotransferase family protein [Amycolatopsis sp. lyj-23]|uniref:phosphotransferase family protein n=1 Tax=Amycolatopsis sp. lyj-23 TaxID=2789283 RepID=UPI0039796451
MTALYDWSGLPAAVRDAVHDRLGPISEAVPVAAMQSASVALTLRRPGRPSVFLKGVEGVSTAMRWLRNEAEVAPLLGGLAPEVLFHQDVGEWLVVGFAHVDGRPAALEPGSPDLPAVATAVNRIGAIEAPHLRSLAERWKTRWWPRLATDRPELSGADVRRLAAWEGKAPELLAGDCLLHTDLHAGQFLLGAAGSTHVVDWGWPASGAPWIDPAFLVIRLVAAGHRPADAEAWARAHTRWASAPPGSVTAFAAAVAGLWTGKAAAESLARTARDYASWRLALTP